jgi:hypothetical protein
LNSKNNAKDRKSSKAAADLAAVFEEHFVKLPPMERTARKAAFDRAVSKIGFRAKSATPSAPPVSRRVSRQPE